MRLDEKRILLGNFEKILEENSTEKMTFYIISGKVVAKYRALENNTRFLQQFFPISGGERSRVLPPPLQAPMPPSKKNNKILHNTLRTATQMSCL